MVDESSTSSTIEHPEWPEISVPTMSLALDDVLWTKGAWRRVTDLTRLTRYTGVVRTERDGDIIEIAFTDPHTPRRVRRAPVISVGPDA